MLILNAVERIEMLWQGKVISDNVKRIVFKAMDWLNKKQLDLDSDNGQMFITHLAMSLERCDRGEEVVALPEDMMGEVRSSKGYGLACEFIEYLEELLNYELPECEKGYILLHLSVLKEGEVKCD